MKSIHTCVLLFFLTQVGICFSDLTARLNLSNTGEYSIQVKTGGQFTTWLTSAPTFFRANSTTFSLEDNTLEIISYDEIQAQTDDFGLHNAHKTTLMAGQYLIETWVREYKTFFTFDLVYLNDTEDTKAENCASADWPPVPGFQKCYNYTISAFPSFIVDQVQGAPELGFFSLADKMFGDYGKQFGKWKANTPKLVDGMLSGPLALFDVQGNTLLISPLNQFMTSSMWHQNDPGGRVNWGTMGGIHRVPAGFTVRTIVVFEAGINKAFEKLGIVLRTKYSDEKKITFKANDITINNLGYWTDNGAYYYYNQAKNDDGTNMTYQDTLLTVKASSVIQSIPYSYLQIDSWWYYRGILDGIKLWSPMPGIFPNGIQFLSNKTGWPIAAHNRYWAADTTYAKQNNGSYNFIKENVLSLPDDPQFWTFLLQAAKKWGLTLYEQDWLNIQTIGTTALQTNLTTGERWLQQMNDAAVSLNIPIQYCMALPRHALQSLKYPAVTQARVSEDYHLQADQWKIGISSIFADAMGLAPYKDTFWTTTNQSGNPRYPDVTEPYPDLECLVSTLSTGPVGPGDKVDGTNRDLLMRCCNENGLILKPSHPAKAIDRQIIKRAIPESVGPVGEVWTSYSVIPQPGGVSYFGILLAADLQGEFTVYPNMTGFPDALSNSYVFAYNDIYNFSTFNNNRPLRLSGCTNQDFCLYYFSQIYSMNRTTMSMIGEMNKWVPMSPKRVNSISRGPTNLLINVSGGKYEEVTMFYVQDNTVKDMTCNLGAEGHGVFNTATMSCGTLPTTEKPFNKGNNSYQHLSLIMLVMLLLASMTRH